MIEISDAFRLRLERGVSGLIPGMTKPRAERAAALLGALQAAGGLEEQELLELMRLLQASLSENRGSERDGEDLPDEDAGHAGERGEEPTRRRIEEEHVKLLQLLALIYRRNNMSGAQKRWNGMTLGRR